MGADRRPAGVVAALVVVLLSCLVTAALFVRVLPPRAVGPPQLSGEPPLPEQASPIVREGATEGRLELVPPRFAAAPRSAVGVRLATYTETPSATVTLEARGEDGTRLGRCTFPPTSYADNGLVTCPVAASERVRTLVVSARGATGPVAVYAALDAGVLRGGRLYSVAPPDDRSRLEAAWDRLAVTRPTPFAPAAIGLYLTAGLAALGWAAVRLARLPADWTADPDAERR